MNRSPHGLKIANVGGRQGRDDPASHAATVACYRALLRAATAPFRWMRTLNVGDWCAILMVGIGICAWVSK